jgi:hypothetical protein
LAKNNQYLTKEVKENSNIDGPPKLKYGKDQKLFDVIEKGPEISKPVKEVEITAVTIEFKENKTKLIKKVGEAANNFDIGNSAKFKSNSYKEKLKFEIGKKIVTINVVSDNSYIQIGKNWRIFKKVGK